MGDPNAGVIQILSRTQPWVSFLSIVGFLNSGLIVLLGLASWIGIGTERVGAEVPLATHLLVYPVMFILVLFPSLYLQKYAKRIRRFVAQGHQAQLEAALETQRRFWVFTGLVALVVFGITGLVIVIAIVIGVMASL